MARFKTVHKNKPSKYSGHTASPFWDLFKASWERPYFNKKTVLSMGKGLPSVLLKTRVLMNNKARLPALISTV